MTCPSRVLKWADAFLRELTHSLGFHEEVKSWSHIYRSGVIFHLCPLPCHVLQKSSECLALAKGDQQLPTMPAPTQVFSSMILLLLCCTLSTLRSTLYQFHVSWILCGHTFSMTVLVYELLMGWPCVQLLLGVVSGSVLCTERQSGGGVTAYSSYFSFLLLFPLFLLHLPEGLGASSSLDHFIEITLITLVILEDSEPSVSSIIWHICYSFSFQCCFFKSEFIIISFSDDCFEKKDSTEFRICGTWMESG